MAKTEKRNKQLLQLGLNIAYYRKMKGLTQVQVAEKLGMSRTHLSNIEAPNMPISVSLETLFDIADALEIPIQKLFEFRE